MLLSLGAGGVVAGTGNSCCKSQAEAQSFSLDTLGSVDQTSAKEPKEKFCSSIFSAKFMILEGVWGK